MICQNCGKNEINYRYTQVINGVKKEIALCGKCAKELGLENLNFNMPINFSSFINDFFNDTESLLPSVVKANLLENNQFAMGFDNFVGMSDFGLKNYYITLADKISPFFQEKKASDKDLRREYKEEIDELTYNKNRFETSKKEKIKNESLSRDDTAKQIEKLQKDLQKAIDEERYEDAAKLRDYIKGMKKNGGQYGI